MFKKAVVTGGAGFIGSHIVDRLLAEGTEVTVYDNFKTGSKENVPEEATIVEGDIKDTEALTTACLGADIVFHFAANADVRGGMKNLNIDLNENVIGTHSALEATRKAGAKHFVFASSATVYGEPETFPTKESEQLCQTSVYGASKLCGEAYIEAYSEYFGIRSNIFRFVSWIGERYSHGVVYDFVKKLQADPTSLEILGDGSQKKSYLYVKDGVEGIFRAINADVDESKSVYNLGHDSFLDVVSVANIVCEEMGLSDVTYQFSGGKRGWVGDSPFVHLDVSRMKNLGWNPNTSIETGLRRTVRSILETEQQMAGA